MKGSVGVPTKLHYSKPEYIRILGRLKKLWARYKQTRDPKRRRKIMNKIKGNRQRLKKYPAVAARYQNIDKKGKLSK